VAILINLIESIFDEVDERHAQGRWEVVQSQSPMML
jgi:hypothetical protein